MAGPSSHDLVLNLIPCIVFWTFTRRASSPVERRENLWYPFGINTCGVCLLYFAFTAALSSGS